MAKRTSLLAPAMPSRARSDSASDDVPAIPPQALPATAARSGGKRPGKYHLGAYFDPADPTAEAFRVLAARTRRSHQDLLTEAIGELVAKYEADKQFGKS